MCHFLLYYYQNVTLAVFLFHPNTVSILYLILLLYLASDFDLKNIWTTIIFNLKKKKVKSIYANYFISLLTENTNACRPTYINASSVIFLLIKCSLLEPLKDSQNVPFVPVAFQSNPSCCFPSGAFCLKGFLMESFFNNGQYFFLCSLVKLGNKVPD